MPLSSVPPPFTTSPYHALGNYIAMDISCSVSPSSLITILQSLSYLLSKQSVPPPWWSWSVTPSGCPCHWTWRDDPQEGTPWTAHHCHQSGYAQDSRLRHWEHSSGHPAAVCYTSPGNQRLDSGRQITTRKINTAKHIEVIHLVTVTWLGFTKGGYHILTSWLVLCLAALWSSSRVATQRSFSVSFSVRISTSFRMLGRISEDLSWLVEIWKKMALMSGLLLKSTLYRPPPPPPPQALYDHCPVSMAFP